MAKTAQQYNALIDKGRVYIHKKCGSATRVNGADFVGLSNPMSISLGSYCAACRKHVKLDQIAWENTGETLKDYRSRLKRKVPRFWQLWCQWLAPVIGGCIGLILGGVIAENTFAGIFGGAVAGAIGCFMLKMEIAGIFVDTKFFAKK